MDIDQADDPGEENQEDVNFVLQSLGLGGECHEDANKTGKGGGKSKSFGKRGGKGSCKNNILSALANAFWIVTQSAWNQSGAKGSYGSKASGGKGPGGKSNGSEVMCYKCNKSGHIARNCPSAAAAVQRECYKCGENGRIA